MHNVNLITSSLSLPHDISNNLYAPSSSSAIVQSQSTQPLDQQIMYGDEFAGALDEHEQYIYVHTSYPPGGGGGGEPKQKRLSDRYERESLLHVSLSNEPFHI